MRRAPLLLIVFAMLATILVALPASAETCLDPSVEPFEEFRTLTEGDETPYTLKIDPERLDPGAKDAYDLVLNGGGYGHGLGVSQYGLFGGASLGCTATEMLTTYLPGTETMAVDDKPIRVGIFPESPLASGVEILGVRSVGTETLTWTVDGEVVYQQPAEEAGAIGSRYVCVADGQFTIRTSGTCEGTANLIPTEEGDAGPHGASGSRLTIDLAPGTHLAQLTAKPLTFGRGRLDFLSRGSDMTLVAVLPSLDEYLEGLAEVPSSWPAGALEAQAIAGRSFAVKSARSRQHCDCDILSSTSDQFYVGWNKEDPKFVGAQSIAAWHDAVVSTSGTVLGYDFGNGPVPVKVFYSSSHGGASSDPEQVWGTDPSSFPYLRHVDATGWETYEASTNPRFRWSKGWTQAELATMFGWDTWTGIEVLEREPGGRPTLDPPAVRVTGIDDGEAVTVEMSGEQARGRLGLSSALFYVAGEEPVPPTATTTRVSGETRVDTAVALSQAGWPESSTHVVLARSDDPADALAGSALAGQLAAPVLLTPGATLAPAVLAELDRLGVTDVWLLGGKVALSGRVAVAAGAEGSRTVHRLEGEDRFATAVAIATQVLGAENRPQAEDGAEGRTAFLVRGRDATNPTRAWADALAVSAAAATRAASGEAWPVLTTDDDLPASTAEALSDLGITTVVPVGGEVVVTPGVVAEVEKLGVSVADRLAGADRWATSRAVLLANPAAKERLVIATGLAFPDGLAAGPFAAHIGAGLLLVPTTFTADTSPWQDAQHPALLQGLAWQHARVTVTGGPVAIEDEVAERVRAALLAGAS